jgi:hypothetical protein
LDRESRNIYRQNTTVRIAFRKPHYTPANGEGLNYTLHHFPCFAL